MSAHVALWDRGFKRLVPIVPPDATISDYSALSPKSRGKAVGQRGSDGTWFGFNWLKSVTTREDLDRWADMGAGCGIRTGGGLIAIDADTMDADSADLVLGAIIDLLGVHPPDRFGNAPKVLYLLRCDEPVEYMRTEFGPLDAHGNPTERVEILSEGRQFVAHGTHPKTGAPYHWPGAWPVYADLPHITREQISQLLTTLAGVLPNGRLPSARATGSGEDVPQGLLKGDLKSVTTAVRATPNDHAHFPAYDDMIQYGYAIKAALPDHPDEALGLYQEWCAKWDGGENDPDDIERWWFRMPGPFRIGATYLYEKAKPHTTEFLSTATAHFDVVTPESMAAAAEQNESGDPFEVAAAREAEQIESDRRRLKLIAAGECKDLKPPVFVIKGVCSPGDLFPIYAPPKATKSFLALHMAWCVATGKTFFGRKTDQGGVLIVCAERMQLTKQRMAALVDDTFLGEDVPVFIVGGAFALHSTPEDTEAIVDAAREVTARCGSCRMVVLDTLAKACAGADDVSDMPQMLAPLTRMQQALPDAVIVPIHHTAAANSEKLRGRSDLRGAIDGALLVARSDETQLSTVKLVDSNAASTPFQHVYKLKDIRLGTDEDGAPWGSAIVEETDIDIKDVAPNPEQGKKSAAPKDELKPTQRDVFTFMTAPFEGEVTGTTLGAVSVLRDAYAAHYTGGRDPHGNKLLKQRFTDALKVLVNKEFVSVFEGVIYSV